MIRLARLSIRRPAAALFAWAVVAIALSLIGLGVSSSLSPSITTVPGTESSRAQHLADTQFGPSVLVPILLEGPKSQLDRQGPALVRALGRRSDTRVLSAWDSGATGAALRPKPTAATIIAAVSQSEKTMVKTDQVQIEQLVHRTISGPVHASITGQPSIDRAMKQESIDTTRTATAWTLPILFLVLLLLLRAPVAAGLITVLAAGTAFSGLGIVALLGKAMPVDAIAVILGTMTGLLLGVGYGLMFYRRWRNELVADVAHHDAAHAAVAAVETTGRAVLIGGTAVVLALLVANFIAPTEVIASLGVGAVMCAMLAVGAAVVVMPAALVLLRDRAQAFSFGAPAVATAAWTKLTAGGNWVIRDAIPVGAGATALLAVMAIPVLSLETGPPSAKFLPKDNGARRSFERVAKVMGPGWPTPYNIVVVSKTRPITDKAVLRDLDNFQTRLSHDRRIASVVGPGEFRATSKELNALPKGLKDSTKLLKGGKKDLGTLQNGLGQAGAGAVTLRSGLKDAAAGAGTAQGGAGQLHAGLNQARSGAAQISAGLGTALDAARKLRDGAAAALKGSKTLTGGLGQAVTPVKTGVPIVKQMAADVTASSNAVKGAQSGTQTLGAQLDEATAAITALPESEARTSALGAVGSARQAAGGLESSLTSTSAKLAGAAGIAGAFSTQVAQLSTGLAQLYSGSGQLQSGIGQLQAGNSALAAGIGKLAGGGGQLTTGVTALRDGAAQLEAGLGQLAGGLAGGVSPTGQLVSGLGQLQSGVAKFRTQLPSPKDIEKLQQQSPGLFDSGYFVLAAIAGATPAQRNQASFAVNLARGGNAGQITVISRYAADAPQSQQLGKDLKREVDRFASSSHTEASLGGPAGSLGDFRTETASKIWPVTIGITIVVLLLLMALLRTVVLPIVAVAFDLLTSAATFGVITVLFSGANPPLGGTGYVDPMTLIASFAAIFGLTMVYEVQLLARARDEFVRTGDPHEALRFGLRHTAAASTGAAIAMAAAIVPFVIPDMVMVRQLGIGVGVAIALDAFIVRPVLLPAAVELLGRWSWWPTSRSAPHPVAPTPAPAGPTAPPLSPVTPMTGPGS